MGGRLGDTRSITTVTKHILYEYESDLFKKNSNDDGKN